MTQHPAPLVSVIVPVYNVARWLEDCLASIREQTYVNLEIIVVEDCSTDDSLTRLEPHLADPRVRLIRHARNAGLSAARNSGIAAATGAYVLFVDSDDLIAPDLVAACVAAAVPAQADLVTYDVMPFNDGEQPPCLALTGTAATEAAAVPLDRGAFLALEHFAWLKFVRRSVLEGMAPAFPVGLHYEDWPFHWELGLRAKRIWRLEGAGVAYRQRGSSISWSEGAKLLDVFAVQRLVLDLLRDRGGAPERVLFASKVRTSAWAVLTRIDGALLGEAMRAAGSLLRDIGITGRTRPTSRGLRVMMTALRLPLPLGLTIMRIVRAARAARTNRAIRPAAVALPN